MPWTITESDVSQAQVKPPGEPVRWDAVPVGAWVWLIGTKQYACKTKNGVAVLAGDWLTASSVSSAIPCPPDWRFEARVVDGTVWFVPLVEREDKWFDNVGQLRGGDLIADDRGGWYVAHNDRVLTNLIYRDGPLHKFRRPRGPVTLTYTPPETP